MKGFTNYLLEDLVLFLGVLVPILIEITLDNIVLFVEELINLFLRRVKFLKEITNGGLSDGFQFISPEDISLIKFFFNAGNGIAEKIVAFNLSCLNIS